MEPARATEEPIAMSLVIWQERYGVEGNKGRESDRLANDGEKLCLAPHPDSGLRCTVAINHAGTHLAGIGGREYAAEWKNDREPYMCLPEGL